MLANPRLHHRKLHSARAHAATAAARVAVPLSLKPPRLRMHSKTLVLFRSKSQGIELEEMVQSNTLEPSLVKMKFVMMQERIQALIDRGLLGPQALLEWKPTAGQEFSSEDTTETVLFTPFFEREFWI